MRTTMTTRTVSKLGLALGVAAMLASRAESGSLTFDSADAIQGLTVSGDVSVDISKDRGGAQGLEAAGGAPASPRKGGSLRVGPGGKAVWPLREKDGTGVLELWVYEDAAKPANPRTTAPGPCGG